MSITRKLMSVDSGGSKQVDDVFSIGLPDPTASTQLGDGVDLAENGGSIWLRGITQTHGTTWNSPSVAGALDRSTYPATTASSHGYAGIEDWVNGPTFDGVPAYPENLRSTVTKACTGMGWNGAFKSFDWLPDGRGCTFTGGEPRAHTVGGNWPYDASTLSSDGYYGKSAIISGLQALLWIGPNEYLQAVNGTVQHYTNTSQPYEFDGTQTLTSSKYISSTGDCWRIYPNNSDLYIYTANGQTIRRWTMTSPWDIDSVDFTDTSPPIGGGGSIQAFDFTEDGKYLFVAHSTNKIYCYVCPTPFNPASATQYGSTLDHTYGTITELKIRAGIMFIGSASDMREFPIFGDRPNKLMSYNFKNDPDFFQELSWTGDGNYDRAIEHNLNGKPGFIAIKQTSGYEQWYIWHTAFNNFLYSTAWDSPNVQEAQTVATRGLSNYPDDTHIHIGSYARVNGLGESYVAYVFPEDVGAFGSGTENAIKCGEYNGNRDYDGPEVDVGFEPQWVMIKTAADNQPWCIFDSVSGLSEGHMMYSLLHESVTVGAPYLVFTPTGFKILDTSSRVNDINTLYSYVAIAAPARPARGDYTATDVFALSEPTGNNTTTFDTDWRVGMGLYKNHVSSGQSPHLATRRMWKPHITPTNSYSQWEYGRMDSNTGWAGKWESPNSADETVGASWREAEGFFGLAMHYGTGSPRTVPHALGVAPEMMWIKRTDASEAVTVIHKDVGVTNPGLLCYSTSSAANLYSDYYIPDWPTATEYSLGYDTSINRNNGVFEVMMFASAPGVSKIGSYDGTHEEHAFDCGFTNGARWVLIKCHTSTGDWYVFDTVRGIAVGASPYYRLNVSDAEVASDFLTPHAEGFKITTGGTAALNSYGESYIYMAIA